jgi:hypothetical protein
MNQRRRAYKTNRNPTVMFGLDNSDIMVFCGVGVVVYVLTDVGVASIILKGLIWGIAGFLTWSIWFKIKDDMSPKFLTHIIGWHATPDLLEVRPATITPVPLAVNLPNKSPPKAKPSTPYEPQLLTEVNP